jgi:CRP-like cAMP-binding protein
MSEQLVKIASHPTDVASRLKKLPVFKEFTEQDLYGLQDVFHFSHCNKDSVVFYEADQPRLTGSRIYFLIEGSIKLVKYSIEGESTIVRLVAEGEFFGLTSALLQQPYPFSAEALQNSSLLYIHQDKLEKICATHPRLALNLMAEMGQYLWFNYETHNQVVRKSEARVAKILLHHLHKEGGFQTAEGLQLKVQLPHDYIASMAGIAYEESVRIISRLKKQSECIQYLRGGKILITDLSKLKELALEPPLLLRK